MAVIVSLTLAGGTWAGGYGVPSDPEGLVGSLAEDAQQLAGKVTDGATDTTGEGTDEVGDGAEDLLGSLPDDATCEREWLGSIKPQEDDRRSCGEGEGDTGSDEKPAETGTDDPILPEDLLGGIEQIVSQTGQQAEEAADEAASHGGNLIRALIKPLQEASQEAGRMLQGAIDSASDTVEHTASQAIYMAGYLTGQAFKQADRAVSFVMDEAAGLLRSLPLVGSLLAPGDDTEQADSSSGDMGTRSVTVESADGSTLALGMIIASGVGLAFAGLAALRRLLGLGGLALLSRIPSSQLMKNGTRNAIFEIVRTDPGVSLNEIVDRMALSRNAVAYHLAVFESEKLMTSVKDGKYRRYFLNGGRYVNGAKDVVAAIKNEKTLEVIRYIAEHPGVIQKDVCSAVGTSPSATSWHIRRLERVGLVEKEREANMVRYRPGPNMARYDLSEFGLTGTTTPQPVPPQEVSVQA